MDADERKVLSILSNTNKTLFDAQKSNRHRIEGIRSEVQKSRVEQLEKISIRSMDSALDELRDEIYNMLRFSREYMDFLVNIDAINIYDAAEIITEIDNILRFKNIKHFISYAGLAPVTKRGKHFSKVNSTSTGIIIANKKQDPIDYCENLKIVLTRCTKKLIRQNNEYKMHYHTTFYNLKQKHPDYPHKRIELMSLKKATIKFAKHVYREFYKIAKFEELEND